MSKNKLKDGTIAPVRVMKSIQKSIREHQNGETISLKEFKLKHFLKRSK